METLDEPRIKLKVSEALSKDVGRAYTPHGAGRSRKT